MFQFRLTHTPCKDRCRRVCTVLLLLTGAIHSANISLLLGGGYGFLTGEHGLVLDNLVQVRPSAHSSVYCLISMSGYRGYSSRGCTDC